MNSNPSAEGNEFQINIMEDDAKQAVHILYAVVCV